MSQSRPSSGGPTNKLSVEKEQDDIKRLEAELELVKNQIAKETTKKEATKSTWGSAKKIASAGTIKSNRTVTNQTKSTTTTQIQKKSTK
ncbi:ribosomal protein S12 methylthiotransferase RimO [Acrasis kona]|uniref:Ribosomal protein S12 methylthiotransferase RimO n=1 Tax=Acrasis kona TaxID=1008807 RepID=A0AAW2ZLK2_9EUKA